MIELLNQLRFGLLTAHNRASSFARLAITPAVMFRALFAIGLLITSNWGSWHTGVKVERQANWNGADYVTPSAEAKQAMQQLASDARISSLATVEIYAINYRLPGYYQGIWGTGGTPKNRYFARDLQWAELQRSECVTSDQTLDAVERAQYLEIYCPINFDKLSLPVGFVLIRWQGKRPNKNSLSGYSDRLFDVGRLISR